MTTNYTPDMNDGRHIFVFGSNLAGRHGLGAAAAAKKHWGAVEGVGRGRTGNAYAVPTKDARLFIRSPQAVALEVAELARYARANPHLTFLVTAVGTGYARNKPEVMAPLFDMLPSNCQLPHEWKEIIERHHLSIGLRDKIAS